MGTLFKEEGYVDRGAIASKWGRPVCDYTCKAYNALKPSRRDYCLASALALELIHDFRVDHVAGFPVRDILQIKLKTQGTHKEIQVANKTRSLASICWEKVK